MPTSTRKRRGEGAARRGEILAAAKRLFIAEGYEQTTMRRVAAGVGVSPTALYLYFPDKDALLLAIAADFFAELLARLEQAAAGAPGPLAALEAGLRAYVRFGLERTEEYRLTFLSKIMAPAAPGRPDGARRAIPAAESAFAVLEAALAALVEARMFRPAPPALLAKSFWAAVHGLTTVLIDQCPESESREAGGADPAALTASVIGLMIAGAKCGDK